MGGMEKVQVLRPMTKTGVLADDKSPKSQLNIYDGKQTLKSDALGGVVLIWAKRSNKAGEADLGSCQVEFMTSDKIDGSMTPDSGKRAKTCNAVFNC
ncbi:hypothetical protein KEM56_003081 [Ascosphaera pollenicola]|nr:hypothetical protein KEM56_003081 [Ascosphaera pollenicola]